MSTQVMYVHVCIMYQCMHECDTVHTICVHTDANNVSACARMASDATV